MAYKCYNVHVTVFRLNSIKLKAPLRKYFLLTISNYTQNKAKLFVSLKYDILIFLYQNTFL